MSDFTSELSQMTFVRIGNKFIGFIKFYEKKSTDFVEEMLKVIFNTYGVCQFVHLIRDQHNWVRKFEFDYSHCVFYDFFFVH